MTAMETLVDTPPSEAALNLLPSLWADLLRCDLGIGNATRILTLTREQQQRLTTLAREKLAQLFTYDIPGCC